LPVRVHVLVMMGFEVLVSDATPAWDNPGNLEGHYANCFKIGHNAFEFLLDFGQAVEESARAKLTSRIVIHPYAAKELMKTLQEAISEYESTFGVIREEREG